uniref:GNAT family acetyltransferase n=1 Tax=uncultured marine crenarchaeote E37-7F TaxID=907717 RepID=G9BAR5_9ARCH|nr:GNAT family acetyltransferase [uncultured marine crenarchaeote E37-7F]
MIKNVITEIKEKMDATCTILTDLVYQTENISTQEFYDYLTGEIFSEDTTTLQDILDSAYLMIHELVEISELKKRGIKIHKHVIVESPKEVIYNAHFVAQEFEMDYALKKKDYAWVKRRLRDHRNVLFDDPNLPEKMKPIAQRIYDKFSRKV